MNGLGTTWTIIGAVVAVIALAVGPLYAYILNRRDDAVSDNSDALDDNASEIDDIRQRLVRIEAEIDTLEELSEQTDETRARINRIEQELSLVKNDLQVIHDNLGRHED